GGPSAAAPAAASHPAPSKASFAAYRACLAQHGVARPSTPPTPGTRRHLDPAQVSTFQAARAACEADRPAGGFRTGMFSHRERNGFRACMRDHGVALPKPIRPTAGPGPTPTEQRGGMLGNLDRHDPAVQKALTACRSNLLGQATPAPTPTS
ncbi:MAG TPA: hypothetical protein VGL04_09230, partial [Sporichthyaceae bacterium]